MNLGHSSGGCADPIAAGGKCRSGPVLSGPVLSGPVLSGPVRVRSGYGPVRSGYGQGPVRVLPSVEYHGREDKFLIDNCITKLPHKTCVEPGS